MSLKNLLASPKISARSLSPRVGRRSALRISPSAVSGVTSLTTRIG